MTMQNLKFSILGFSLFLFSAAFAFAQTPNQALSQEVANCLKKAVGEATFNEISSGSRQPTPREIEKGKDCFKNFNPASGTSGQRKAVPPSGLSAKTKVCIEEVLGGKMEDLQGEPSQSQKQEIGKRCFGGAEGRQRQGGQEEMPTEVKNCLKNALGASVFEEIFSGSRPPAESEMERGKDCFKGFSPGRSPSGGGPANVSSEAKACIEKVLGQKMEEMRGEPSEEKKRQIGEKCFGGRGPEGQGSGPELNEETKSCLKVNFGEEKFNKMMRGEFRPSEEEMRAIGPKCFKGGSPGGGPEGSPGGPGASSGPANISPESKTCIESTLGKKIEELGEPSEEQKRAIGEKCFGGKAPGGEKSHPPGEAQGGFAPGTSPGGSPPPEGISQPNGHQLSSDQKACVERILGGMRQPTTAEQTRINQECFAGSMPASSVSPSQGGPAGGPSGPPPS